MKSIISLLFVSFLAFTAFAQYPGPGQGRTGTGGRQSMNIGHFYGKVIDKKIQKVFLELPCNSYKPGLIRLLKKEKIL